MNFVPLSLNFFTQWMTAAPTMCVAVILRYPFYGVDADSLFCDFRSNVDFVPFVWERYERFPIQKFAITILPRHNAPLPLGLEVTRLLYLRHYRALSDGCWKNRENCVQCVCDFQISLRALSACQPLADDGPCIVCRRQPPSLRDMFK